MTEEPHSACEMRQIAAKIRELQFRAKRANELELVALLDAAASEAETRARALKNRMNEVK